ncbi:MAG TPA: response regulator transcription factor [Bryobacteraceae bacterium]|nr:response regulator transcription factor [Bryobacteraceae bacterium]
MRHGGRAENGHEAIEATERLRPDVLILDISMPVMGGIEAARAARERLPELPIIMTSQHSHRAYVHEALSMGIRGYVLKGSVGSDLTAAIRDVLSGNLYCSPGISPGSLP